MQLDLETLQLSSALGRAAYLVVFVIVALRQPKELCLWHWIGAIVSSMIGSVLMADVPVSRWLTFYEALTIYTFYAASLVLSWSGLRLFNERRVRLPVIGLVILLPGLSYIAALSVGITMRTALAGVFVLCSIYAAFGAYEAVNRPADQRLWAAYIVSATLGSYAAMLMATLILLIGTDFPMNSSDSAMISMVVDQAAGILVYFGYIAMAKERAVRTIEKISTTDPMTGLMNRRGLQAELEKHKRERPPEQLSGLFLADIDHFKTVNDTHGHDAGDAVLVAFAQRLRRALRKDDIIARWGGEEFLAILPEANAEMLATIAERLRHAVQTEPFALPSGQKIALTVSVGVSEMPLIASEFEPATKRADTALYEAKRSGRNRICSTPFRRNVSNLISTAAVHGGDKRGQGSAGMMPSAAE